MRVWVWLGLLAFFVIVEACTSPTPPRSQADTPGGPPPYSTWNIEVFKDGYISAKFLNVPVYSSTVSVQPAVLVPLGEKTDRGETYNESSSPLL